MQNEVIKPTINGLLDIMKACVKAKTVRRLVFTSSAGTVDVTEHPNPVIDENCWSDVDFCTRVKMTGWVSFFLFPFFSGVYFYMTLLVFPFFLTLCTIYIALYDNTLYLVVIVFCF